MNLKESRWFKAVFTTSADNSGGDNNLCSRSVCFRERNEERETEGMICLKERILIGRENQLRATRTQIDREEAMKLIVGRTSSAIRESGSCSNGFC